MNGRMYDPMQGRFLSPDNHIQDPFNTQNFNRFGYVLNNPLSLTDPSGEFIATLFAIVKVVSLMMTAAQTLIAIVGGAPIGQVLIGIGIGVLAGLAGGALATGIKGLFSAATTAVGAFVRGAISAFGGQLISGTLASVAQGTSFRKALRANYASAGIAAAAGGFAGASEFKANRKATIKLAQQKAAQRKKLDAMAREASDSLSGNMITADQLAANANATWGPGELPSSFYFDSHLEFDGDNLSIIDNFSNDTTNVRDSFSAVSGPYGNGAIPSGDWNTGDVISPTGDIGMSVGTTDFAIELDANFDLNGRDGFYIHPDGNVPGTLGCIGLNCGVDRINDFLTAYNNYYNRNGSMRLTVD